MKPHNLFILCLIGVIVVLTLVLLFRKACATGIMSNEIELQHQIKKEKDAVIYWQQRAENWHNVADSALNISDSLKSLPLKIKTVYDETYKAIAVGDNVQLDSIIRANW